METSSPYSSASRTHCMGQKCSCNCYHEPMMFGTACGVCGHGKSLHMKCDEHCKKCSAGHISREIRVQPSKPLLHEPFSPGRASIKAKLQLSDRPEAGTKCTREGCNFFVPLDRTGLPIPFCSRACAHPKGTTAPASVPVTKLAVSGPSVEIASANFTVRVLPFQQDPQPSKSTRKRVEKPITTWTQRLTEKDGPRVDRGNWSTVLCPESAPATDRTISEPSSALVTDRDGDVGAPAVLERAPAPGHLRFSSDDEELLAAAGWDSNLRSRLLQLFRSHAMVSNFSDFLHNLNRLF